MMKFFLASSLLGPMIKVLIVMWSGPNVSLLYTDLAMGKDSICILATS